jgi:RNA polymerase sigma-70 factor (ECF subfamily)
MTGHDRAILLLAHVDELPLRIIAEIFDLPLGTVKSRLHAARQRLRTKIESQDPDLGETHETARQ